MRHFFFKYAKMPFRRTLWRRRPTTSRRKTSRVFAKRFRGRKYPSVAALAGPVNSGYSARKMNLGRQLIDRSAVFPTSKIVNLTYCDQYNLASTTSTPLTGSALVYRTGCIYDPDASNVGTNHQPYFFDQISGLYQYYQVFEFAWNVTFFNATTNTCFAAVQITDSGDTAYSIATKQMYQLQERPGGWVSPVTVYGNRQVCCTGSVKLWEIEGIPYRQYRDDEDYQAFMSAVPTLTGNLSIAIGDLASPVQASNVLVSVKLVYKCRVWSRVTQSTS